MDMLLRLRGLQCLMACVVGIAVASGCSDDTAPADGTSCPEGYRYNVVQGQCLPEVRPGLNNGTGGGGGGGSTDTGPVDQDADTGQGGTCEEWSRRCASDRAAQVCTGGQWQTVNCPEGQLCQDGDCQFDGCLAGSRRCLGLDEYQVCGDDGEYESAQRCGSGTTCSLGQCIGGCAGNLKERSNLGCDYISVRHDQYVNPAPLGRPKPHSVVISNPNDVQALITVTSPEIPITIPVTPVAPMSSAVIEFPTTHTVSQPGVSRQIFRISSDTPVIATQFAPLNNPGAGSETSDASLLLPNNVLGQEYVTLGWRSINARGSYVDIVAASEGTTVVTVRSPIALNGGSAGSVPAGGQQTFIIHYNQILHLVDNAGTGASVSQRDVSGIVVEATQPVAVYTGATLVNIPDGPDDKLLAGDHIEQQMFPVNTWGRSYIGAPFHWRAANDFAVYRVVAARNDTTVTFDPPVAGGIATRTLQRGEYFEYRGSEAVLVTADKPIQLGQYMVGGEIEPTRGDGDPAFVLPPAVEQYRDEYVFLVPANYRGNYVTITAPAGVDVTLNGQVIPSAQFTPFAGGQWQYIIRPLQAGIQTASAAQPFGLLVHGYHYYISYAFAGGIILPD
jgi:hypothetical protein